MSKHPMWLRRGIALTLALVMTASLSVSALAAPSVEEAGEDTVLSQTQPDSDSQVPAEGPEGLENGSQAADSLPMIPLEPAEQAACALTPKRGSMSRFRGRSRSPIRWRSG